VVGSFIYSLLRVLLEALATTHGDRAKLQAEVPDLLRQIDSSRSDGSRGIARTHPEIDTNAGDEDEDDN
jgi:hypothetical protein